MSAHTPGPWRVAYVDRNGQSVVMGEHIELATCWHHCIGSIEREMHANARLIAAAPDLLKFAQFVLQGCENGSVKSKPTMNLDPNAASLKIESLSDVARAAITKATGAAA